MSQKLFVVAIAGTSGAGKSTLCRKLCEMIPNSTLFELDMYEEVQGVWPDMSAWSASNFDPNMANLSQPADDLSKLVAGQSIEYPMSQGTVQPASLIIFDSPIGRSHSKLESLVDFVVFVDLPYEIALARRIERIIDFAESDKAAMTRLRSFIPFYLKFGRFYRRLNEIVQPSAHAVVDGMQEADVLAADVYNLTQKRRS